LATKVKRSNPSVSRGVGKPVTMDELLAKTGYQLKGFKRGEKVTGKVVEVTGKTVYIDVGGKAEAIVSEQEYALARDYFRDLKSGDTVEGIVLVPENDAGQVILSLRKAAIDTRWNIMEQAIADEKELPVKVREVTKGGLLVDVDGVFGFIPTSQLGREWEGNMSLAVGKTIWAKVIEVDRAQNRLVLSEKAVTEAEEIEERRKALGAVKVGGEYEAIVVGVVPFGVFAEIVIKSKSKSKSKKEENEEEVKLEGLIHISELSWEKVDDVTKVVKVGDKIKVQVIGIDGENGKLALSVKRLTEDPWGIVQKKYKTDSKHSGVVAKVAPYGVLVRLEKGIEGLIHASKMPGDTAFTEGQKVDVFVESVDLEKRRLSFGVVLTAKPVGYK
jgi:small subunit ribosomal protein S1